MKKKKKKKEKVLTIFNRREVVFLYKLTPGSSTKSFGMHVASMAGVPSHVVDVAEKHAHEFEKTYQLKEAAALSSYG